MRFYSACKIVLACLVEEPGFRQQDITKAELKAKYEAIRARFSGRTPKPSAFIFYLTRCLHICMLSNRSVLS
jgi:hypothetical protein